MTHAWLATLVCGLACGLGACGVDDACGATEMSESGTAPRIKGLEVLTEPVPEDPWEIVLVSDFKDTDGNLSTGKALVFLNGKEAVRMDLLEQFRQSALATDATAGQVTLQLRFADNVPDGADVKLGLVLQDAGQNKSNCYSVDLDFAVRRL